MTQAFAISDVHLGEDNSILTYPKSENRHHLVDRLIEKIREASDLPSGERVPELVLLGDILDLSLAPFREAVDNVKKFMAQICEANLFDTITYVPGNHDHHMWVQIMEYRSFIKNIADGEPIPKPHQRVTEPGEPLRGTYLDGLLPSSSSAPVGQPQVIFQVAYPNRVMEVGGRRIIMHHGHFCERIWTLLSTVFQSILETSTIEDLEAFNSPLTELGWYGLGQAGDVSDLMEQVYENAKVGKFDGLYEAIDALMDGIDRWDGKIDDGWYTDARDWLSKRAARKVVKSLLAKYVKRKEEGTAGVSEARGKTIASDEELRDGVTSYLTKYVDIRDGDKFVFGHTHQHEPEQDFSLDGRTIRIANTGGWTRDPGGPDPEGCLIEITDQAELKSHRIDIS